MKKQGALKFSKYMLDIKDFKIIDKVKSGGFGSVFSVQKNETNEILAAKVINMQNDESQYKQMFSREIGTMIRCQHSTIIRFYGYTLKDFNNQNNVTIFMEFAKKGSLADLLQKIKKGLSNDVVNNTTRQIILVGIARGMMLLHQHKIIHRDLKPDNILLDEQLHPHITDFGLSKLINNFSQSQSQQCGTCKYMAPEVIDSTHYNGKIDVYSFGILMYEVVTDTDPYPLLTKNKLTPFKFNQKVVNENYRPTFIVPVKKSIKKLIERCWSKNSAERPTFEELFKKLAYGYSDSIENIYEEQKFKEEEEDDDDVENDDNESDSFYLENVDVDEVVLYAEEIEKDSEEQSSILDLSKVKEMIESQVSPLKKENKELKEKVRFLEQKLNDLEKSSKAEIDQLKGQIKQKIDCNDINEQELSNSEPFCINVKNELDGIINFIVSQGGNEINVSASSFNNKCVLPINAIRYENKNENFCSENKPNSWLCFDFKNRRVIPTEYTIRNGDFGYNANYPRNWVIEGSNDNVNFAVFDEKTDCSEQNGPTKLNTFKINKVPSKGVQYIRIRSTGVNWKKTNGSYSTYHLAIESFEVYGTLI